jgi:hypothetical protein
MHSKVKSPHRSLSTLCFPEPLEMGRGGESIKCVNSSLGSSV